MPIIRKIKKVLTSKPTIEGSGLFEPDGDPCDYESLIIFA